MCSDVTNSISYSQSNADIRWCVVLLLRIQIERRVAGLCYNACRLSVHVCVHGFTCIAGFCYE